MIHITVHRPVCFVVVMVLVLSLPLWGTPPLAPVAAESSPEELAKPVEWPTFHGDNSRQGVVTVRMQAPPFSLLWNFDLGSHTWKYCEGASVWSACAVGAEIDGKMWVFAGAYDHNVYAIEAATGHEIWRYTTGCLVRAAPHFAWIGETPMLFIASSDRAFYALNARTGEKIWNLETYTWSYTVGESYAGSPFVETVDGKDMLFATMWNGDRRPLRTVQSGEIFAIEAATGKLSYRKELSNAILTSPVFMRIGERPFVYAGSQDGSLYALDARTGKTQWKYTSGHRIDAAPAAMLIGGQPVIFFANAFGMLRCLSAANGAEIWKYKCGHEVLSTPAIYQSGDKLMIAIGASDRCIHGIEAKSGDLKWKFQTDKYVVSSPAVAYIRGRATVFVNSLDNGLYTLDGETGCEIMRFMSGEMLWPYETRGISIWSSPSIVRPSNGKGIVLYPAHDGKLYAFTEGGYEIPATEDAVLTGWSLNQQTETAPKQAGFASPILPVISLLLIAFGIAMTFLHREPTAIPQNS